MRASPLGVAPASKVIGYQPKRGQVTTDHDVRQSPEGNSKACLIRSTEAWHLITYDRRMTDSAQPFFRRRHRDNGAVTVGVLN